MLFSQAGRFLGTLLASIGVPLLLNALTGKGLQVDGSRPTRSLPVYVPDKKGGKHLPIMLPPPYIGTWDNPIGMGILKKTA